MEALLTYWGKELLSVWILVPIVWYFIKQQNRQQKEYKEVIEKWFKNIADSIWRNTPPTDAAIIDMATKYQLASQKIKTDFIRDRLLKNNLRQRGDTIKSQIRSKLIIIWNEKCTQPLNVYNTKVWLLWDWIHNNFPMDEFLEEVYDVVFREDSEIDRKISDIYAIMEWYDSQMWENLKSLLNN